MLPMKALSIRQPWAHLIVNGFEGICKDIENRDWRTNVRGRVLVHASKSGTKSDWNDAIHVLKDITNLRPIDFFSVKSGGIIGSVEIVDCVTESDSPWFFGRFGFVLANPKPLPFRPLRGQLGFFRAEEE